MKIYIARLLHDPAALYNNVDYQLKIIIIKKTDENQKLQIKSILKR